MQKVMPRGARGFLVAERAWNEIVYLANTFRIYSHTRSHGHCEPRDRPKRISEPPGSRKLGQV